MVINWPDIALQTGLIAVLLVAIGLYVRNVYAPRLLKQAEIWMGGAIGRFMQNLAQEAAEEEGGEGGEGGAGLNLGGFKIDTGTIRAIAELAKMAKEFGLIGGGGGGSGGGFNPGR